jgi:hypothetical protein
MNNKNKESLSVAGKLGRIKRVGKGNAPLESVFAPAADLLKFSTRMTDTVPTIRVSR